MVNEKRPVRAVMIAADRLYCSWTIPPAVLAAAVQCEKPLRESIMDLRVFDVTNLTFDGTNAHSVTCIKIEAASSGYWVVKGLRRNRSYLVELGYITMDYTFWPIAAAHPVHTAYESLDQCSAFAWKAAAFVQRETGEPGWIEHPDCQLSFLGGDLCDINHSVK